MSGKRGPAGLDPHDSAMWNRVARTVDPLPGRHILADPAPDPRTASPRRAMKAPPMPMRPAPSVAKPSPTPAHRAKATLDGSWDKAIARGRLDPDATIDLHGLTLDQAWRRLDFALEEAIAIATRVLLVITGKPGRDAAAGRASPGIERPRGMIRAKLEDWIAASRHASAIAAIRGAHPRHGGAGAVYIVLRRKRG